MDKNYYEILEVNRNASSEIVEKAYKTLVKKYHPDLQENHLKKDSEEKLKLINEAYEVLSDEEKRKQYDAKLINSEPNADELINENRNLKNELNHLKQNINIPNMHTPNIEIPTQTHPTENSSNYENQLRYQQDLEYQQQMAQAREKAYHDAYIQDLKNRGYKIKYKKTFRDYFKNFIALFITALILFLLWQIPFVKNLLLDNVIIQSIIKIFSPTS